MKRREIFYLVVHYPKCSQELELSQADAKRYKGPKHLGLPFIACPAALAGSWTGNRGAGT